MFHDELVKLSHGHHLSSGFVWYVDVESFLDFHNQFDGIETHDMIPSESELAHSYFNNSFGTISCRMNLLARWFASRSS